MALQQQQSHQMHQQPQLIQQQQMEQQQQMQSQSQQMQQQNQQIQQQSQQNQQQTHQMQQQLQQQQNQQQSQQMQQVQSMQQQTQQLQHQSQQIQQQISSEVSMSANMGTMSIQVAPQSTMTSMQAPPGSMAIQIPQSISSISQSSLQQQQQSETTSLTTMSSLQQQQPLASDWAQGRVQVIQQQPLQNATYLQQLYNPQSQLLMQGNLALHSAGVNPGSIQVIAAGKPFQSSGPHILTQGKQVITAQGQTASFPGYTTIPTTNSQTLLIGQLGVISSQPNILPAQASNGQSKQDLQKYTAACNRSGSVQQNAQPMQFSPWQFSTASLSQNIWTASPQQPTLLATQNSIFIRGAAPQDTAAQAQQQTQHMFIQNPPTHHSQGIVTQSTGGCQSIPNSNQISQQDITVNSSIAGIIGKPRGSENIQPKTNLVSSTGRPPLLPNSILRPASSVSTQTAVTNQIVQSMHLKPQAKIRAKSVVGRGAGIKSDFNNQNKPGVQQVTASRMILTSHGTLVAGAPAKVMQQQQQQSLQQQQHQQQQSLLNIHQQMNVQQQQQISFQQQQIIQSRPTQIMGVNMTPVQQQTIATSQIQQIGQSQQPLVAERPVMPVLSMDVCPTSMPTQGSMQTSLSSLVVPPQLQPISPQLSIEPSLPLQTHSDSDNLQPNKLTIEKVEAPSESVQISSLNNQKVESVLAKGSEKVRSINGESLHTKNSIATNGVAEIIPANEGQAPLDDTKERSTLPKAMVKPQLTNVLTHVIEGFVIQEASEPFPVNKSSLLTDPSLEICKDKRLKLDLDCATEDYKKLGPKSEYGKCEMCGKVDFKSKFKKAQRFCSMQCAKRFNINVSKNINIVNPGEEKGRTLESGKTWEQASDMDVDESNDTCSKNSQSPLRTLEHIQHMDVDNGIVTDSVEVPKVNPLKWTVTEVCDFIKALPGCYEYAEDFATQEIDGQALMLLREDHLMSAMSMKLGPALKIVAKIDLMRETKSDQQSGSPEKGRND